MNVTRPNILLIMSDQHNASVMGCAGDPVVRTPHLDALAQGGVRFENAYCPYPLCSPSRMAFMAGRFAGEVNVWKNGSVLASDVPTFAHALNDAGYDTALCGRMHFNGPDQLHGFKQRLVGDCWDYLSPAILGRGKNRTTSQSRYAVEVSGHGRTGYEVFDQQVTAAAQRFISQRQNNAPPYCLVVGYMLPHNPLICARELFDHYMEALPPIDASLLDHPAVRAWRSRRGADRLSPEQIRRGRAAYYGLVTTMDQNVGRLLSTLRQSPDAQNTVVIYCSDHGDQAGEHGMWWKSSFFEGSVGVPLMASWPGEFAQGVAVDAVVNLIDIAPTLTDLAGTSPLPKASGHSLLPMLRAGRAPSSWVNETFAEFIGAHGDQPSAMIRSGPWKLMYYAEFDSCLLFNLDADPAENVDRAADPTCATVRDELLAKLRARWSAQAMLDGADNENRQREQTIEEQSARTYPVPAADVPADADQFDFSQVPGWEQIQARAAAGEP